MICPKCGEMTKVMETQTNGHDGVWRHRQCKVCEHEFATDERQTTRDRPQGSGSSKGRKTARERAQKQKELTERLDAFYSTAKGPMKPRSKPKPEPKPEPKPQEASSTFDHIPTLVERLAQKRKKEKQW